MGKQSQLQRQLQRQLQLEFDKNVENHILLNSNPTWNPTWTNLNELEQVGFGVDFVFPCHKKKKNKNLT